MKNSLKGIITLCLIAAICGGILGITYDATKDTIAAIEKKESLQLDVILPGLNADEPKEMDVKIEEEGPISSAYEVYAAGELVGHAIIANSKGMGPLKMTVGITKDGKIGGLKIVSHAETPGIGDIVEKESFMGRYKEKSVKEELKTVKTSPSADNEVEGITGATITSTGVTKAVNEAIKFYKENVLGEEVKEEKEKPLEAKDIISEADNMKDVAVELTENVKEVKGIYKGEQLLGYAITGLGTGMEEIQTMVGISNEGKVVFVKVVADSETEGIGDVIHEKDFINKFLNKSVDKKLEVVKNPPSKDYEIEAVSGATISTEGVTGGVNNAIKFYKEKLKK